MFLALMSSAFWEVGHQSSLHSISNADYWWHLRIGIDILQKHTFPHTGWGSRLVSTPWIASTWAYDVGVALVYRAFGLRSIVLVAIVFRVLAAAVAFLLGGGINKLGRAILLSLVTQYLLLPQPPLPVYGSIVCFGLEFWLLDRFRRLRDMRLLYGLPCLFLIWANLDWHFVYGLILLVLWAAAELSERQKPIRILAATASSFLAAMVTPYGWKAYGVFYTHWTSAANRHFAEEAALRFRSLPDYVLMLLVMAAFLSLGVRQSRDMFTIGATLACALAAFHAQSDSWLAVMASVGSLGTRSDQEAAGVASLTWDWRFAGTVAAALALPLSWALLQMPNNRPVLLAQMQNAYPLAAADYIRQNRLPGPIFNCAQWGGFLEWYLPEYPAAIDGRRDLHGDDSLVRYARVMNADEHYTTLDTLNNARTLVLEKKSLIGMALATVPSFRTVYSDDLAIVLLREGGTQ